jgi:hypothetical protein
MAEAAGLNPVQRGFDPRRGYSGAGCRWNWSECLQSLTMPIYVEEDPDDDPDEPEQPADGAAPTTHVPSVGMPTREWEYSTEVLTVAQVADGTTLVKVLQAAGADGWELADVVDGGEKRVLLMRRSKRSSRESRRVGFAPPAHN